MKRFPFKLHLITWTTDGDPAGADAWAGLVNEARKGDRKAQKALYVGDRETAEDLLQEGFITLFSKLDSYSGAGSFEGWARKIFVNTALMHLRKTDALKLSDDISEARSLSDETPRADQQLGYRQLLGLIASLPADARTVFNMYVVEGYTHKEIAKELGCTEATSRSKLQRARLRLQQLILQEKKV